jgi:hypothetical protein
MQNYDMTEQIDLGDRTQLFVANDPAHVGEPGYCNPQAAGYNCVYYVSVIVNDETSTPATFTIAASTPDDVEVVPCRPSPAPDGLIIWGVERLGGSAAGDKQSYEVCGNDIVAGGLLDVEVETCSGQMEIKICDGDGGGCEGLVPEGNDWNVKSTSVETCNKANAGGVEACQPTMDGRE